MPPPSATKSVFVWSAALALLAACAQPSDPVDPTSNSAEQAALVDEAARAMDRYCIAGLPDVEAIAVAMSADAGPDTGKAYTPYHGPEGFIGASLRAGKGYSANTTHKDDGRIVCGVALFTPASTAFETAILDRVVEENGIEVRDPRSDPEGGVTYSLGGYTLPATLSFRERQNESGETVIGAVITVASAGDPSIGPAAAPVSVAAAPISQPTETPPDPEPATAAPPPAEPSEPAELASRQPEPAAPVEPAKAASASPVVAPQAAATPTPPRPSKPAPTMPRAERPASLTAPSLYEGAPYSAFTREQIAEFCKQDWKRRRVADGRTEYNPCFERGAFR